MAGRSRWSGSCSLTRGDASSRKRVGFMAVLALMLSATAIATPQHGDYLTVHGFRYEVYSPSLIQYFGNQSNTFETLSAAVAPGELGQSSACWRGYWAKWEVRGDRLYLTGVFTPRAGRDAEIPLLKLFGLATNAVSASWYTGTMESPRVLLRYIHGGYGGDFLYWRSFRFQNGRLAMTAVYPSKLVALWVCIPVVALAALVLGIRLLRKAEEKAPREQPEVESE